MLYNIRTVSNGYILEDEGYPHRTFVAKSLKEAAEVAGELPKGQPSTVYSRDFGAIDLAKAKAEFVAGNKITAIKIIRDCFEPRLGLREAKDLVEQLCG